MELDTLVGGGLGNDIDKKLLSGGGGFCIIMIRLIITTGTKVPGVKASE